MPYSYYPTDADVESYIGGLGLSFTKLDGRPNLSSGPAAAAWEVQSLWRPFFCTGIEEDRFYDPPAESRYIELGTGLLSLTSLITGYYADGTGTVISAGFTQPFGQSYRCLPVNAPQAIRPYELVEFLSGGYGLTGSSYGYPFSAFGNGYSAGPFGRAGSVKVRGLFGRVTLVPDDVWQAVLEKAVMLSLPALSLAINSGLMQWTQAGVSETYNADPLKVVRESLTADWQCTLDFYKRLNTYAF